MNISTQPADFTDDIVVEIDSEQEGHCIITLTSQAGRVRRMMGVNLVSGHNQIHIENVSSLEKGYYQLQVKSIGARVLYTSKISKS